MATIEIPAKPGCKDLSVGSYFEYESVWYFQTGVWNAWEYFSPPGIRKDPPIIKPDMRAWLVERNICLKAWEERGNLTLVFHNPETFMLFRLTWL